MKEIIAKEDFKLFTIHLEKNPDEAYSFIYQDKSVSTLVYLLGYKKNFLFIKKVVHYLIDNYPHYDFNEEDSGGNSILFLAMPFKDEELLEKMIKKGANLYHRNCLGLNLLFLAIQNLYPKEYVLSLIEKKIDVEDMDVFNHTIFTKYKTPQYTQLIKAISEFKQIEQEKEKLERILVVDNLSNLTYEEKKRKKI